MAPIEINLIQFQVRQFRTPNAILEEQEDDGAIACSSGSAPGDRHADPSDRIFVSKLDDDLWQFQWFTTPEYICLRVSLLFKPDGKGPHGSNISMDRLNEERSMDFLAGWAVLTDRFSIRQRHNEGERLPVRGHGRASAHSTA